MSLAGRRILYTSTNHGWERGWTFYQQLASALARENEVVYVDTPLSVARARGRRQATAGGTPLPVVRTWTVPLQRNDLVRRAGARWSAAQVQAAARKLGFEPDLVWLYAPAELAYADRFPRAQIVYWTGDEVILPREPELLERAAAILCVSQPVFERHSAEYPEKAHFVPVACDFETYRAASGDVDATVAALPRPILGYSGWINERVDVGLLQQVAERTSGTVVVAGPVERADVSALERLPNVRLLGPQPADAVPRIINAFDVALIPYVDSVFNRGSNPVKFYEYLALGKPVVSTDIPTLRPFGGVASIGDAASFADRALAPVPGDEAERLEVARAHSYDALLERLGAILR